VEVHQVYGSTKDSFVTNKADFKLFLEAVVDNPASKVIIRITMDDPNIQAAKKSQVGMIVASSL
jgi:hypothetical protein